MLTDNDKTRMALYRSWREPLTGQEAWSAVIAKANELAADTIRVVRCPEVEVVGELADPVEMHGGMEEIVVCFADGGASCVLACVMEQYRERTVTRWCLASDLARDPKTATWHERTVKRVRRWTPETVPDARRYVVVLYADKEPRVRRFSGEGDHEDLASMWNRVGNVVAWAYLPDAERAE